MCKFCEIERGDCAAVNAESVDVMIGRRIVGKYEIYVTIDRNEDDTYDMSASLFTDDGDATLVNVIPIKYCPFCGRTLHDDV